MINEKTLLSIFLSSIVTVWFACSGQAQPEFYDKDPEQKNQGCQSQQEKLNDTNALLQIQHSQSQQQVQQQLSQSSQKEKEAEAIIAIVLGPLEAEHMSHIVGLLGPKKLYVTVGDRFVPLATDRYWQINVQQIPIYTVEFIMESPDVFSRFNEQQRQQLKVRYYGGKIVEGVKMILDFCKSLFDDLTTHQFEYTHRV